MGDYLQIIEHFKGVLAKKEDVPTITVKLRELADFGRNPTMHSRKVTIGDYHVRN